jgi:hypothetical protein
MADQPPYLKNKGPLLVDKVRGWFDQLPAWFKGQVTIRAEKQKVDAKIDDLDPAALDSELKQELTDEKLRTNRYLGDGDVGSGNDMSVLPASNVSQIVLQGTGQVADVLETVSADEIGLTAGPPLQDGASVQVGDVWVTKTVEASTFDDARYQVQIPDLLPEQFRSQVPTKTVKHTVDGVAVLPTLASGELSRAEEQGKVGVKSVTVQSRDLTTPAVLVGQKVDPQWNGATLDLEQKIVPANTNISQPFGTTDVSLKPIDGTNALQEKWKLHAGAAAFPVAALIIDYNTDLQTTVATTQSVVAIGDIYTPGTYDLEFEERYIDAVHKLRRVSALQNYPASFDAYVTREFTFPGLLTYLSFALVPLAAANRKDVQYAVGVRAPFTVPTVMIDRTEFFVNPPAYNAVPLFTWAPTDIVFKGLSYTINIPNVLTDALSSMGVTFAGDAYYGNTVDRFNVSATSPSATGYINVIGQWAAVSVNIDRYKRLWVRKTTMVILR